MLANFIKKRNEKDFSTITKCPSFYNPLTLFEEGKENRKWDFNANSVVRMVRNYFGLNGNNAYKTDKEKVIIIIPDYWLNKKIVTERLEFINWVLIEDSMMNDKQIMVFEKKQTVPE